MNGFCIWLTGLPGSGKTKTAKSLCRYLKALGMEPILLDGDDVRKWLTPELGYSRDDRRINVLRVAKVASLIVHAGGVAVVAMVSPYEKERHDAIGIIRPDRILMVYVHGRQGNLWPDTEYEVPGDDAVSVNTRNLYNIESYIFSKWVDKKLQKGGFNEE